MERDEIVEYKERSKEDDDEYDEVGKIIFININHSDEQIQNLEIQVLAFNSLMKDLCNEAYMLI